MKNVVIHVLLIIVIKNMLIIQVVVQQIVTFVKITIHAIIVLIINICLKENVSKNVKTNLMIQQVNVFNAILQHQMIVINAILAISQQIQEEPLLVKLALILVTSVLQELLVLAANLIII